MSPPPVCRPLAVTYLCTSSAASTAATTAVRCPKGWPTTGKVLSDRLKRLQPTLAARGVLFDSGRTSEGRYLEMTRQPVAPPHEQKRVF